METNTTCDLCEVDHIDEHLRQIAVCDMNGLVKDQVTVCLRCLTECSTELDSIHLNIYAIAKK